MIQLLNIAKKKKPHRKRIGRSREVRVRELKWLPVQSGKHIASAKGGMFWQHLAL